MKKLEKAQSSTRSQPRAVQRNVCFSWKRGRACVWSDHCAQEQNMQFCMQEQVRRQWSVRSALAVIALSFREYLRRRMDSCSARTPHHHYHHPWKNHTHHHREPYHRCSQGCQLSTCCSGAGNDEEEVLLADEQFYQFAAFRDFLHNTTPPQQGICWPWQRSGIETGKTITVFYTWTMSCFLLF